MVTTAHHATTMELARLAAQTKYNNIPKPIIEHAKEAMIDLVGRTLAGNNTFPGKAVVEYVKEMKAKPESTVIGAKLKTIAPYAAWANSSLGHCLELEDVGKHGSFDATGLLCVVLAVGEKLGANGKAVLEAYVVGHEIQGRTSRACIRASSKRKSLYKFGFLGCATAAAKLIKMDSEGIATAISLAASQAAGIGPVSGTMAHYLDFRTAARSGIEAALLAEKGITARKDILEGADCFLDEYVGVGDYDLDQMTREWGKGWEASRVRIKKYSCCFLSHPQLDTLLGIMKENKLTYDDIKSVELEIGLYPLAWLRFDEPKNEDESHFSFKHVLATAILTGRAWIESFTTEAANDPKYAKARKKIKVTPRPDWDPGRAGVKGILHVRLKNGKLITQETSEDVIEPTRDEIIACYKDLSKPFLSAAKQKRSLEMMTDFENVGNVAELMEIVR